MSKGNKRGISKSCKDFLVKSYKGKCQYCFHPGNTLDHIIPLSKGGARGASNITLACTSCNNKKGDKIYPNNITKPLLEAAAYRVVYMEFLTTVRYIKNKKKRYKGKNK